MEGAPMMTQNIDEYQLKLERCGLLPLILGPAPATAAIQVPASATAAVSYLWGAQQT